MNKPLLAQPGLSDLLYS